MLAANNNRRRKKFDAFSPIRTDDERCEQLRESQVEHFNDRMLFYAIKRLVA